MTHGRCLCGDISYTLSSELLFLYNCHCVECRRFSGASHATNATIVAADLQVSDPNTSLRSFALSIGTRYFCGYCGSPIYSSAKDGEIASLHCGSITNIPERALDGNLWTSEKCPWIDIDSTLANFEKAPK